MAAAKNDQEDFKSSSGEIKKEKKSREQKKRNIQY